LKIGGPRAEGPRDRETKGKLEVFCEVLEDLSGNTDLFEEREDRRTRILKDRETEGL
jgi:hypothetical protein